MSVTQSDGSSIQSTHTGLLPQKDLSKTARIVHLFPKSKRFLVSLGKLCDAGIVEHLNKYSIKTHNSITLHKIALQGNCSTQDGMWHIDVASEISSVATAPSKANSVYEINKKEDMIKCLSAAMWNLVPETWIKAIEAGFFATWPGLTSKLVKKHLTRTI